MNMPFSPVQDGICLRRMHAADLEAVMVVEEQSYPWPWRAGNFRDCLQAGYSMWVLENDAGGIVGYAVVSIQADEAHLLNICVAPEVRARGQGRRLLRAMLVIAKGQGAQRMFLEVRPSNVAAIALYHGQGFNEIGRRPRYYPADNGGREDALVMAMELLD